ncbi:hypothetical protein AVEN_258975-1 [Araneus ventricosus]|uniref:Uncharacterized protein n=1 Tax=Araneus ventricosus TaxID=182803 RepID=A0A4Y2CFV7_ARAVE|nr:hypothetical protein AVEN_258975-1 [Araneus ventricosus]
MLHAAFHNIKSLPHFGVRWRVFFNTFVPVGIVNFYCLPTAWQISKSVTVAASGMSSSMDIHSSYTSFCIPSGGSMKITDQREVMKNISRNSWNMWSKVAPRCLMFP